MVHELDLDDAVGNVTGDLARRELDELRGENERLNRICNEQVASIDAMEMEIRRLKRLLRHVLRDIYIEERVTEQTIYDIDREVIRE